MGPNDAEVMAWFRPKETHGPDTVRLETIREAYERTAAVILNNVPPSAHRTAALRDLHDASMSAIFALTHKPEEPTNA